MLRFESSITVLICLKNKFGVDEMYGQLQSVEKFRPMILNV